MASLAAVKNGIQLLVRGQTSTRACRSLLTNASSRGFATNNCNYSPIITNILVNSPSTNTFISQLHHRVLSRSLSTCSPVHSLNEFAQIKDLDEEPSDLIPFQSDIHAHVQSAAEADIRQNRTFAIVYIGGTQFKVTVNDIIIIPRIDADVGDQIYLNKVLAVGGRQFTLLGKPLLKPELVSIEAMVLEKPLGEEKHVFKKKRRKNYKKWNLYQAELTVLKINKLQLSPDVL